MARERAIQIRVSHEEYEAIKANAGDRPISEYVRDLAVTDGASFGPRYDEPEEHLTVHPAHLGTPTEDEVKTLALKLSGRLSTRNARLEAERQLGLK